MSNAKRLTTPAIGAGCSLKPGFAAAQLPGLYYRQYSRCLPDHLTALARAAYQKRNHDLSLLNEALTKSGQPEVRG